MRHPFELNNSELVAVELNLEELTNDETDVVPGGLGFTIAFNEGGSKLFPNSSTATTLALGEEGDNCSSFLLEANGKAPAILDN